MLYNSGLRLEKLSGGKTWMFKIFGGRSMYSHWKYNGNLSSRGRGLNAPCNLGPRIQFYNLSPRTSTAEPPKIKDLMKLLYNEVPHEWDGIGTFLEIGVPQLESIRLANLNNPQKCLLAMLNLWLNRPDPPPSWEAIAEAVEVVGRGDIAQKMANPPPRYSAKPASLYYCTWLQELANNIIVVLSSFFSTGETNCHINVVESVF